MLIAHWIFEITDELAGPDPDRCNRCKCIGQKKIADACIGQIFTANNEKHHFLRPYNDLDAQILPKLLFPRNWCQTHSQIYI